MLTSSTLASVRFALDNPSHYRVTFASGFDPGAAWDPELSTESEGAFQALVDALVEQQAQGLVRRDDPLLLAHLIWALVHGIAMLAIDGPFQQRGVDIAALTRYAVERIRTGTAGA